jgi:MFS family permease
MQVRLRRVTAVCSVGTFLEYFDVFIANIAAATAWPTIFFAGLPTNIALAFSILSMGLTYLSRPVGAWIFGHIGDRVGRRTATMWTLIIMGVGAGGIGLMPTIASIGVVAPLSLAILRIIQGLGIGGEVGAGATWVLEAADVAKSKHRGFWASWVHIGSSLGNIIGSILTGYMLALGTASYISFNWRIPFLVGAVAAVIGGFARFKVMESPIFMRSREERKLVKNPPAAVIREKWKTILPITAAIVPFTSGAAILISPYTVLLLMALHVNSAFAASVGIYYGTGSCIATIFGAILCDRVGRKIFAVLTPLAGIIFTYPYFIAMGAAATAGNTILMILILIGLGVAISMICGAEPAILAESFETKYRISGANLSLTFAIMTVGVIVSFGLSSVIGAGGPSVDKVWPLVAGIMVVISLVGLIGSLLIKETKNVEI